MEDWKGLKDGRHCNGSRAISSVSEMIGTRLYTTIHDQTRPNTTLHDKICFSRKAVNGRTGERVSVQQQVVMKVKEMEKSGLTTVSDVRFDTAIYACMR